MTTTTASITTLTPAEVDTAIAKAQQHFADLSRRASYLHNDKRDRQWVKDQAESMRIDALQMVHAVEALYQGWQRWYIVRNANGHIHTSMSCSTCFADTDFGWLPEDSGFSGEDMVLKYGETVCTVCVPEAPTYTGFEDGTSDLARLTAAEKAAKAAEKAAKRAKADAEAIAVEEMSSRGTVRPKTYKTERAAANALSYEFDHIIAYGADHPAMNEWEFNARSLIAALPADLVAKRFENKAKALRKQAAKFDPKYCSTDIEAETEKAEYVARIEAGIAWAEDNLLSSSGG